MKKFMFALLLCASAVAADKDKDAAKFDPVGKYIHISFGTPLPQMKTELFADGTCQYGQATWKWKLLENGDFEFRLHKPTKTDVVEIFKREGQSLRCVTINGRKVDFDDNVVLKKGELKDEKKDVGGDDKK